MLVFFWELAQWSKIAGFWLDAMLWWKWHCIHNNGSDPNNERVIWAIALIIVDTHLVTHILSTLLRLQEDAFGLEIGIKEWQSPLSSRWSWSLPAGHSSLHWGGWHDAPLCEWRFVTVGFGFGEFLRMSNMKLDQQMTPCAINMVQATYIWCKTCTCVLFLMGWPDRKKWSRGN